MVYVFSSATTDPPALIYMGKDKFENEDLIKYGIEEDIWFHVDQLSSAHVYLRLLRQPTPDPASSTVAGRDWQSLDAQLLMDCAQLCKANSIEGNKRSNVTVLYTPWSNLHKTGGMETGQVGFKKPNRVKKVLVEKRENVIINRLMKTRQEVLVDQLRQQKFDLQRQDAHLKRHTETKLLEQELDKKRALQQEADLRSYRHVLKPELMQTNEELVQQFQTDTGDIDVAAYEEDFF